MSTGNRALGNIICAFPFYGFDPSPLPFLVLSTVSSKWKPSPPLASLDQAPERWFSDREDCLISTNNLFVVFLPVFLPPHSFTQLSLAPSMKISASSKKRARGLPHLASTRPQCFRIKKYRLNAQTQWHQ